MIKFTPDAAHDIINALAIIKEPLNKCCWNCAYSDHEKGMCKKYNAIPPMQIITFGCKDWDNVPF